MGHTVHLIDACPWVFRAWFSLPETISTPDGAPAGALRGFSHTLFSYLRQERPTHVALAFDESLGSNFRREIYPDYKSSREPAPEELKAQLRWCRELTEALGVTTWAHPRYEADDILATLAKPLRAEGHQVVVVTSDKDLCQLVDDGLQVLDTARRRRFDAPGVKESFGVRPEQIPDYLGLAGDAVDDIPGVPGVGPKSAVALLEHFAHLEDVYADLPSVATLGVRGAKSLARKLDEHEEQAYMCRRLATLSVEAPVQPALDELRWHGAEEQRLMPVMERLGLMALSRAIPRAAVS